MMKWSHYVQAVICDPAYLLCNSFHSQDDIFETDEQQQHDCKKIAQVAEDTSCIQGEGRMKRGVDITQKVLKLAEMAKKGVRIMSQDLEEDKK